MNWSGAVKLGFKAFGLDVRRVRAPEPLMDMADLTEEERGILEAVEPYTHTSRARLATLLGAVRHVVEKRVPGDIAECGVWRGGSMMAVARMLRALGDTSRHLYLFDTYTGMPAPTERDADVGGSKAADLLADPAHAEAVACFASLEDVRRNLLSTGYPEERLHFIEGKVEETIPGHAPERLALLRLDTDWYESTRHELQHLYPRVSRWGALIIDDYGHWQGARQATDEFCASLPYPAFLHRIDYTARLLLKPVE